MKLTVKDKEFLGILRQLLAEEHLSIGLVDDGLKRLALRQNYGSYIEQYFGMTRQGVRWRFNHVFNEIYVSAYTAIVLIETAFGTELRQHALSIAKERVELREKARKMATIHVPRRQTGNEARETAGPELSRDSPSQESS
jgi:hypothetical protein